MMKEGRTWHAIVTVASDKGRKRIDAIVAAVDFDSAVGIVRRTWPSGDVVSLESSIYEAIVTGD